MTFIVTEPCIKCKYTDCADVCPVDCFHEGANMLVIDPDVCIDCDLCVDECPVTAIFSEDDLPEKWNNYLEINAKFAPLWPEISNKKDPLPEHEEYAKIEKKTDMIDPTPGPGD